jgi:hypothetical protein
MSRAAAAPEIGPRVDIAKPHQRLQRPRKIVNRAEILRAPDHYPPAGSTKPAGDLILLGGSVLSDARKAGIRDHWIAASYLVAITLAMIGWLWLIAWMTMRLV